MNLTDEEEITRKSYDANAHLWAPRHLSPRFWGKEMDDFRKFLPSGKILEIGCGGGRDARELIELGYDYTGTDVSKGLLEQAKKNNPGAKFIQVSLYNLDFTEKFDGFWCAAVLLHIPRKRIGEALASLNKNIKRGGYGFITVKEGDGEVLEEGKPEEGGDRLFVYWRDREFSQTLKKHGFEVVYRSYKPMSKRTKWLIYIVQRQA